jgi:hypothetical protein
MSQFLNERVMSELGYAHARLIKLMSDNERVVNEFLMSELWTSHELWTIYSPPTRYSLIVTPVCTMIYLFLFICIFASFSLFCNLLRISEIRDKINLSFLPLFIMNYFILSVYCSDQIASPWGGLPFRPNRLPGERSTNFFLF